MTAKRGHGPILGVGVIAGLVLCMQDGAAHASIARGGGNWHRGWVTTELYRGVGVPDEILVLATPGDCQRAMRVTIVWDEELNFVRVHVTGKNVLQRHPSVDRTEGVDFFTNPFWPEAKDFDNGRYQLWVIVPSEEVPYYYDPVTLDLIGSGSQLPNPPANAIVLNLPGFNAVPTDFFQPDENGDVDFTHVFAYDAMVRGDLPQYGHTVGTLIPHNLCFANPYRYDITSTRPHGYTLPASEARPFSYYLRGGLIFDVTVEPPQHYSTPPISTNVATYSQGLVVAGGVPKGWTMDLEAIFSNVAPAIRPFQDTTCTNWFKPVRNRSFNQCVAP